MTCYLTSNHIHLLLLSVDRRHHFVHRIFHNQYGRGSAITTISIRSGPLSPRTWQIDRAFSRKNPWSLSPNNSPNSALNAISFTKSWALSADSTNISIGRCESAKWLEP